MDLVSDWRRQTARAMGVSLVAPMALLLAAAVLAASGGWLGGLGSLGQITSGPPVPEAGRAAIPRSTAGDAALVTAPLETDGGGASAPGPAAGSASVAPGAGAGSPPAGGGPGITPRNPTGPEATGPRATEPNGTRAPAGLVPDSPRAAAPAPPASPPAQDPTGILIDTARRIENAVPAPLKPITEGLFDPILGPPR